MKGTSSGYTQNGVDYPDPVYKTKVKIFPYGDGAREFLETLAPANIINIFNLNTAAWVVYQENENDG